MGYFKFRHTSKLHAALDIALRNSTNSPLKTAVEKSGKTRGTNREKVWENNMPGRPSGRLSVFHLYPPFYKGYPQGYSTENGVFQPVFLSTALFIHTLWITSVGHHPPETGKQMTEEHTPADGHICQLLKYSIVRDDIRILISPPSTAATLLPAPWKHGG